MLDPMYISDSYSDDYCHLLCDIDYFDQRMATVIRLEDTLNADAIQLCLFDISTL